MEITILILAYWMLLDDILQSIVEGENTLLISSALAVILSLRCNTDWGIVMLVILSLVYIIIVSKDIYNKK